LEPTEKREIPEISVQIQIEFNFFKKIDMISLETAAPVTFLNDVELGCSLQGVGVEVDRGRPGALAGRSLRPEPPPAEKPGIKYVFG
jgi:hypothetical protein